MIQKEVNEIKKTLKFTDCSIRKMAGCYIDTEKGMHVMSDCQFLCLPEEDQHKYFDLIKKGLSGRIGKNLLNMGFDVSDDNSKRDFLVELVNSELKDDKLLERYFELIRDSFDYVDNYCIIVLFGVYDVPGKTTDGIEMEDASDEVYSFTLTLLCPMKPSKAGLSYNAVDNSLQNAVRSMMVEAPVNAYLFPAFTDRSMDIHNLLFYSKKPDKVDEEFIEGVFGCRIPMTPKMQNESFISAVETIPELTFDIAKNICQAVSERQEQAKEDEFAATISQNEAVLMLERSGIKEEKLEEFEAAIEHTIKEDGELLTGNIIQKNNKLTIDTGVTTISMPLESADTISVQRIDGRNCLVIELNDEIRVNGLKINKYC